MTSPKKEEYVDDTDDDFDDENTVKQRQMEIENKRAFGCKISNICCSNNEIVGMYQRKLFYFN